MRKLTVKNFSVIKEAELEFGKITVLIGPQSSGKSLLCRLTFFLDQFLPEFANSVARRKPSFKDLSDTIQRRFTDWFPVTTWSNQRAEIEFASDAYSVSITFDRLGGGPVFHYSSGFPSQYDQWKYLDTNWPDGSVGSDPLNGPYRTSKSIYIPSGRAFFSTPNKGIVAVSLKQLDWITQRFSTEMDYDYRAMIASTSEQSDLLHNFGKQATKILRGRVVLSQGTPQFQQDSDSRILPFDLLSSGTLELLPILSPLAKITASAAMAMQIGGSANVEGPVFIEEPESGIFPSSQYELARLFSWLVNERIPNLSFVVTTHSPYVMTAFNTLMEAGRVGSAPGNREKVIAVIPEKYWIQENDFKAYAIENGVLVSIFKPEAEDPEAAGMINGDYLDSVSDQLGKEFDRLLDIEYAE